MLQPIFLTLACISMVCGMVLTSPGSASAAVLQPILTGVLRTSLGSSSPYLSLLDNFKLSMDHHGRRDSEPIVKWLDKLKFYKLLVHTCGYSGPSSVDDVEAIYRRISLDRINEEDEGENPKFLDHFDEHEKEGSIVMVQASGCVKWIYNQGTVSKRNKNTGRWFQALRKGSTDNPTDEDGFNEGACNSFTLVSKNVCQSQTTGPAVIVQRRLNLIKHLMVDYSLQNLLPPEVDAIVEKRETSLQGYDVWKHESSHNNSSLYLTGTSLVFESNFKFDWKRAESMISEYNAEAPVSPFPSASASLRNWIQSLLLKQLVGKGAICLEFQYVSTSSGSHILALVTRIKLPLHIDYQPKPRVAFLVNLERIERMPQDELPFQFDADTEDVPSLVFEKKSQSSNSQSTDTIRVLYDSNAGNPLESIKIINELMESSKWLIF